MQEGQHVVAVAALVFRGPRLLCMRRAAHKDAGAGLWETLSGRVQHGEAPLAAIAREIDEECGLEVEIESRPVDAYSAQRAGAPMVVIVYRARYLAGDVRLSEEHDTYAWLTPDELAARSPLCALVEAARKAAPVALSGG